MTKTVTIRFSREFQEYRVPGHTTPEWGIEKREDAAYYTDDVEDAIGTARIIHPGAEVQIRRVK